MNRDPYQIIIMRPTGGKAIMTLHSLWIRLAVLLALALVVVLLVMGISLFQLKKNCAEQIQLIDRQTAEIKDLNISIAQKDEKIFELKKRMSTSIRHQPVAPLPEVGQSPEIHAPIVAVTELMFDEGDLSFRIESVNPGNEKPATGYFFAVFKEGNVLLSYPAVPLAGGMPQDRKAGVAFSVRNFKPMRVKPPKTMQAWTMVTFYVFDDESKTRLAMAVSREQIQ